MTDVKSMTMEELKEFMTKIGEKPFRAKQIYAWLHQQLVTSFFPTYTDIFSDLI